MAELHNKSLTAAAWDQAVVWKWGIQGVPGGFAKRQVSAGKAWDICIPHRSPRAYNGAWVPTPHLTRRIFTDGRQAKAIAQNDFQKQKEYVLR